MHPLPIQRDDLGGDALQRREFGIVLALLLGWQFTLAEFVGGPLMILFVALAYRVFLRRELVEAARRQADKGLAGSMEGHAAMDMSIAGEGTGRSCPW